MAVSRERLGAGMSRVLIGGKAVRVRSRARAARGSTQTGAGCINRRVGLDPPIRGAIATSRDSRLRENDTQHVILSEAKNLFNRERFGVKRSFASLRMTLKGDLHGTGAFDAWAGAPASSGGASPTLQLR